MTENNSSTEPTQTTQPTQPTEPNTNHNQITQQMYDDAKRRARNMEGLVADRDAKAKELGFDTVQDMVDHFKSLGITKDYEPTKPNTKKDDNNIDEILKQAKEEARKPLLDQIKEANDRADQAAKSLYQETVVRDAIAELKDSNLIQADMIEIVKDMYLNNKVQRDEDGSLFIVDENNEPVYINGQKKTITDLANELIEKHPSFKTNQASNNGRPSGASSIKANTDGAFNPKHMQSLTDKQERINYFRATVLSGNKK